MNFSDNAFKLVAELDFRQGTMHRTFYDERGRLGVGYGHVLKTGESVKVPMASHIAAALLLADLKDVYALIKPRVQNLSQCQVDAVVAWGFCAMQGRCESGDGQTFEDSRLLEYAQAGKVHLTAAEFDNWASIKGRPSIPLSRRRQLEQLMFLGNYTPKGRS